MNVHGVCSRAPCSGWGRGTTAGSTQALFNSVTVDAEAAVPDRRIMSQIRVFEEINSINSLTFRPGVICLDSPLNGYQFLQPHNCERYSRRTDWGGGREKHRGASASISSLISYTSLTVSSVWKINFKLCAKNTFTVNFFCVCVFSPPTPRWALSVTPSLWFSLPVLSSLCNTVKHTKLPTEGKKWQQRKQKVLIFTARLGARPTLRKQTCQHILFSMSPTSTSPSNSVASSRVTLKGAILSRLEPFCGDLRFLFGDVFSDVSSVSRCSSGCLEFCSFTTHYKRKSLDTVSTSITCQTWEKVKVDWLGSLELCHSCSRTFKNTAAWIFISDPILNLGPSWPV